MAIKSALRVQPAKNTQHLRTFVISTGGYTLCAAPAFHAPLRKSRLSLQQSYIYSKLLKLKRSIQRIWTLSTVSHKSTALRSPWVNHLLQLSCLYNTSFHFCYVSSPHLNDDNSKLSLLIIRTRFLFRFYFTN